MAKKRDRDGDQKTPEITRECIKCHKQKPADSKNFYKHTARTLGLDSYCIPCRNRTSARHYRLNRKHLKEKHLEWYHNNKAAVNKKRSKRKISSRRSPV